MSAPTVYAALEKDESNDLDRYIIDRLDRTLFLVSQLESAVRSDLVRIEDVRFPLTRSAIHARIATTRSASSPKCFPSCLAATAISLRGR